MIRRVLLNAVLGGSASLLITGCAATRPQASQAGRPAGRHMALPEARPLGAHYPTAGFEAHEMNPDEQPAAPTGTLKLEQALGAALLRNPSLAAFSHNLRAVEARLLQARALPNPELEFGLDEYDRDGKGLDAAETSVTLGQLFELGGKRHWRTRVAEAEGELAGWDYESKRLDVFTETARRFTAVIVAQQRFELAGAAVQLAEKTSRAVRERVKAGKEPPLQASKSEAELEMVRMDLFEANNVLRVARRKLAAMWGGERAEFSNVEGHLDGVLGPVPSMTALRSRLALNPDLARWDAEIRMRRSALSLEKSARVPDVTAAIGFQSFEEDGTDSLALGVGLPLPLFDRNQGNIAAAAYGLSKAEAERSAAELALAAELAEIHAGLTTSYQRVEALRGKVVPAMEQAFAAAHEGYQQGKFGFLDMLDAQRGLFQAKGALVDALSDYHTALADIQGITGTSIEVLMNGKKKD
ncbi:MAG: TolC family protein [Verrucomicrobia bacterium]|nr:TolC family protein [Verrucomicrobiota bacterium]